MKYLQVIKETKKAKLDLKDKKILSLLAINSRIPLTQLSKRIGLSRDTIKYRIKNYEKIGLIQGYRTLVDISKFKYDNYHLFIKLNNPSQETEKQIINKISILPFIRAIIKFGGGYDFEIAMIAKGIEDLDNKITKVIDKCDNLIQENEILIISKILVAKTFPKNFFDFGESIQIEKLSKQKTKGVKIDKKDIQILNLIAENANIQIIDIADKTKISPDSVAYRIKNMINSGIIKKFIPVINYSSLDYNLYSVLLNINSLNEKREKTILEFLINNSNTLWAVKTIGKYNILIYFLVKNTEELQETVLKLRGLFPKEIKDYQILIGYEEYKYTYFPKNLF